MPDSFYSQLARAEETLISAISHGSAAVETFYDFWSRLQVTFSDAVQQERVDTETMELAQQVGSRIEIIARQSLELHEQADSVVLSLQNELDVIFANLNLGTSSQKSEHNDVPASPPPYIGSAYTWLLNHLHNPYPSKETKSSIALESGSSLKDIENWFINVRKRIGWNTLRMKHYNNKRSKIVDAATRFFKEFSQTLHHGPFATHLSGFDLVATTEFKAIESRAKALYSDKLSEAPLTTKADGTVRDLMPGTKVHAQCEAERHRQVAKARRAKKSAYPSPECSPERSREPSPEQSPGPSAAPVPILDVVPTTSHKRRNYDRDSPELGPEDRSDKSQKRSRLDSYQISHDLAVASLPSPVASLSDIIGDSSAAPSDHAPLENGCIILPTRSILAAPSGKRKRRLSDAGHDGPPKRPHNALAVPRVQTVSDPLPLANPTIGDFYKATGDNIPEPVSVESLDDTPVEVNFYNYNTFADAIQPLWLANSSSDHYFATNSELPSLDKSQVSDPSLDFLFGYLEYPDTPQDMPPFSDILSYDHSTLFSYENTPPNQPPQEDVLSDPCFQIPSLPWDFEGDGDIFSIIAPSAGTLFSSNPVPPAQNEKEAKRKEIEALRAKLQNLEAEEAKL